MDHIEEGEQVYREAPIVIVRDTLPSNLENPTIKNQNTLNEIKNQEEFVRVREIRKQTIKIMIGTFFILFNSVFNILISTYQTNVITDSPLSETNDTMDLYYHYSNDSKILCGVSFVGIYCISLIFAIIWFMDNKEKYSYISFIGLSTYFGIVIINFVYMARYQYINTHRNDELNYRNANSDYFKILSMAEFYLYLLITQSSIVILYLLRVGYQMYLKY